jgi:hypothetical protein
MRRRCCDNCSDERRTDRASLPSFVHAQQCTYLTSLLEVEFQIFTITGVSTLTTEYAAHLCVSSDKGVGLCFSGQLPLLHSL